MNNLIEDIYKTIEPLSDGQALDISEQQIEDFGEAMKDVMRSWANPTKRDSNFSIRMSNVGKGTRRLWFDNKYKNKQSESKPNPPTQIKFLYGHMLEELVKLFVTISGHDLTGEQKEVVVDSVSGHIDCIIDDEVVDIKTASGFAFSKFKNGTLRDDDPFGYLGQLAGYEESEGTSNGGLLVINKENGELCFYQPEDLDKPNIRSKIKNIKKALKKNTPPADLCFKPVADGTKGNEKIHKNCAWCPYKFECFEDSNNGKGLRVFQYSKGYAFLTKVVVQPKVQEVDHEFQALQTDTETI
tara:strand:+ start:2469 stop:3365 length:897 start_codon:yes stop_codon:yes gene_type:complete